MFAGKKIWLIILAVSLGGVILGALHVTEYALDVFGYGLAAGFILSFLYFQLGYLKQPAEYYDDLDNVLSHFEHNLSDEKFRIHIKSIEQRINEFKQRMDR